MDVTPLGDARLIGDGVLTMSSMMADVRQAAVPQARLMEIGAQEQDAKLQLWALAGIAVRVLQVLVLVRMINLFFR
jgi:hypothetical protein